MRDCNKLEAYKELNIVVDSNEPNPTHQYRCFLRHNGSLGGRGVIAFYYIIRVLKDMCQTPEILRGETSPRNLFKSIGLPHRKIYLKKVDPLTLQTFFNNCWINTCLLLSFLLIDIAFWTL